MMQAGKTEKRRELVEKERLLENYLTTTSSCKKSDYHILLKKRHTETITRYYTTFTTKNNHTGAIPSSNIFGIFIKFVTLSKVTSYKSNHTQ